MTLQWQGPSVAQHVKDQKAHDADSMAAAVPEDADVDGEDDVVVVAPKITVQGARSALHTAAAGVASAVDLLELMVAHDTKLASAALRNSDFVSDVASVEQSLLMVRRNMRKLQARLDSLSRRHACQQTMDSLVMNAPGSSGRGFELKTKNMLCTRQRGSPSPVRQPAVRTSHTVLLKSEKSIDIVSSTRK